ncbi:MAG: hypothetical protein H7175_14880, partial [Burkholderiales bacterium]|nr:hypothetical protein [Anaerolineae bacterium]
MIQLAFENVKNLVEQSKDEILSAYLMVDPALPENQANNPAWRVWLKSRMNELESGLSADSKGRFTAVRTQVDNFLAGYQPNAKSLVLFFGADEDSQNSYELPISLESNRATFGEPAVAPLLWAIDEFERYLVVLVDSEKSVFFTAYLGGATFEERIELNIEDYDWGQKT